ncbi:hypothetical protein P9D77_11045 [Bacillus rugosus]|uniref:hypothetical protein n=1 Tax=Bacillus rugosus TaxID=2715209 RepID=UPI002DBC8F94|nr:hypothetical protein [Bacillus rugosus]MEC1548849.1 hypothetical protein [Bacillus rugosus]
MNTFIVQQQLRDHHFQLVQAHLISFRNGEKSSVLNLHVSTERCYSDFRNMFEEEAKHEDRIEA